MRIGSKRWRRAQRSRQRRIRKHLYNITHLLGGMPPADVIEQLVAKGLLPLTKALNLNIIAARELSRAYVKGRAAALQFTRDSDGGVIVAIDGLPCKQYAGEIYDVEYRLEPLCPIKSFETPPPADPSAL